MVELHARESKGPPPEHVPKKVTETESGFMSCGRGWAVSGVGRLTANRAARCLLAVHVVVGTRLFLRIFSTANTGNPRAALFLDIDGPAEKRNSQVRLHC
jgi:hypothetical protein